MPFSLGLRQHLSLPLSFSVAAMLACRRSHYSPFDNDTSTNEPKDRLDSAWGFGLPSHPSQASGQSAGSRDPDPRLDGTKIIHPLNSSLPLPQKLSFTNRDGMKNGDWDGTCAVMPLSLRDLQGMSQLIFDDIALACPETSIHRNTELLIIKTYRGWKRNDVRYM